MAILSNSTIKLAFTTYRGDNQATHPDIIDFKKEYGIDSWNGYRYWIAFTPYPNTDATYENPEIHCSNDGINWVMPSGITNNPIDLGNLLGDPHLSDTDLVYDPLNDYLMVYYRINTATNGGYETILLKIIYNDLTVSEKITCYDSRPTVTCGKALSPAVWRKSATEWYMYLVDLETTTNGEMLLLSSNDGKTFAVQNRIPNPFFTFKGEVHYPWHICVKPNLDENRLEFMINWNQGKSGRLLWYAESPMSNLTQITAPINDYIIIPNATNWDNYRIYRSTFVIYRQSDSYNYKIWYSAQTSDSKWYIGLTEGVIGTNFTKNIASIDIVPNSIMLNINNTVKFSVKALDRNNSEVDFTPQFLVSDNSLATITSDGFFTALGIGTVAVIVTNGIISNYVIVTIVNSNSNLEKMKITLMNKKILTIPLYKQNEVAGDIIGISTQNGLRYLEIVSEDDVRATAYGGTKLKISTNNGIKAIGIYK